jgi:Asp-tRNA(Asn)/Glu-tRNA(Gln) amidotransferase A subunit family amidase
MAAEFAYLTASEIRHLLTTKQASAVEIVTGALERLDSLEPTLNAFVVRTPDLALAAARQADAEVAQGTAPRPLLGVPVSVKDLIDLAGVPTRFGSRTTPATPAPADAPSVERVKAAGGCTVGKTTTTEFGCKAGGGDSPLTGITRNPWDPSKSTGGSSAGAAASVAAGVTPVALGTDGGGSCRIPAALCGLVGVKAQYGRVPVFPPSATPSLGHVGAIARTVADAALLLQVLSGFDPRDPASVAQPVPDFVSACRDGAAGLRVAWSPTLGYARVEDDQALALAQEAVRTLEKAGCAVDPVERVFDEDPIELWNAEFYAGVGVKLKPALEGARDLLDPAVAALLERALYEQTLEQYVTSFFERFRVRERFRQRLEPYDVLVTPTLPVTELAAGADVPPGLEDRNAVSWVYYTYPFNLTGNPAASIPCGFTRTGMPVGLQIVARTLREVDLFRVAGALESAAPWAEATPVPVRRAHVPAPHVPDPPRS